MSASRSRLWPLLQQNCTETSMPVGICSAKAHFVPVCNREPSHRLTARPLINTAGRHIPLALLQRRQHVTRQQRQLSTQVVCAKARKPQAEAEQSAQDLPQSREQAVSQAAAALALQLNSSAKTKGFKGTSVQKLAIDVPVADQSAPGVAQLVADLLQGLSKDILSQLTVICSSEDAAQALQQKQQHAKHTFKAISLGDAFLDSISGSLIIVAPAKDEVEKVEVLLSQWKGRIAVVLNADWAPDAVDVEYKSFATSFESVYSFLPIAVQGWILKTDIIMFKKVTKGKSPSGVQWAVFIQKGQDYTQIARQQQRPTTENIEFAYYNYSASQSPLTKGVKLFKNLIPSKK